MKFRPWLIFTLGGGGVCVLFFLCFYFLAQMTHEEVQQQIIANTKVHAQPVEQPVVEKSKSPSTEWAKCISGTATVDNGNHKFEVLLKNRCDAPVTSFNVTLKFLDATDARIGWDSQGISSLEVGEKVRWQDEMPMKSYPLTANVARIEIYSFSEDKDK